MDLESNNHVFIAESRGQRAEGRERRRERSAESRQKRVKSREQTAERTPMLLSGDCSHHRPHLGGVEKVTVQQMVANLQSSIC
jgi:hypothetical protein